MLFFRRRVVPPVIVVFRVLGKADFDNQRVESGRMLVPFSRKEKL